MHKEKECFVIAPIGEKNSQTRKRSDQILKNIVKPAAAECGYVAIRADEIFEPGPITDQVIQRIIEDPLVIADLTEGNPNVFYELALRHAFKRPVVQLIRTGDTIPFDVRGMRTIEVDHHDMKSVEEARKKIVAQIRAYEGKKTIIDEIQGLWLEKKQKVKKVEGPFSLVEFDIKAGQPRVRGRSYGKDGKKRVDWPHELSVCWNPPGRDELFHMFDGRYGPMAKYSALGVSKFKFLADRQHGEGYFVVHGSGDIKKGAIDFELERITKEYLLGLGLESSPLTLDEDDRCSTLIKKLLRPPRR